MERPVFICHASEDASRAEAVVAALEGRNVPCWIAPRDVDPGAIWASEIATAIEESQILVLVFTAEANGSKHVIREVERAIGTNTTLVTIRMEDVDLDPAFEYFLSATHWLDVLDADDSDALERAADKIAEIAQRAPGAAKPKHRAPPRRPQRGRLERYGLILGAGVLAAATALWWFNRAPVGDYVLTMNMVPVAVDGVSMTRDPGLSSDTWTWAEYTPAYAMRRKDGVLVIDAAVPAREKQEGGGTLVGLFDGAPPRKVLPGLSLTVENRTDQRVVLTEGTVRMITAEPPAHPLFLVHSGTGNQLRIRNYGRRPVRNPEVGYHIHLDASCDRAPPLQPPFKAEGDTAGTFLVGLGFHAKSADDLRCISGRIEYTAADGARRKVPFKTQVRLSTEPAAANTPATHPSGALAEASGARAILDMAQGEQLFPLQPEVVIAPGAVSKIALHLDAKQRGTYTFEVALRSNEGAVVCQGRVQMQVFFLD